MQETLDAIWKRVVGGMDWLKQVIFGEFDENRDLSAIIADMLLSFVPGVIIVTSARDLTAVLVRLAKHPEKREHVEEWMLLIACAIPLVLPILAAAVGAAAAGVGAIVGGIAGSEVGAALRAVCLLLIRKGAYVLAELVGFLRRFIKGDILKVLREVRFVQYGDALVKYIGEFIGKIAGVIHKVRAELLKLNYFHWLADTLSKLEELERGFYAVQQTAIKAIPKALVELDARLQHMLSQALPQEPRLAPPGVPAGRPTPVPPKPARVPAMPGNGLGRPEGTTAPVRPEPALPERNVHPETPREPTVRVMKEEKVPCFSSANLPASKAAEMERQLAGQQAGLNNMTVQEYLDGRKAYGDLGRNQPLTGTSAADARAGYETDLAERLTDRYIKEGVPEAEADRRGAADAASQLKTLAALHTPDMIAGGSNAITDIGDRSVNSSIGPQWKGRVNALDEAASAVPASERANTRMNAKLERCK